MQWKWKHKVSFSPLFLRFWHCHFLSRLALDQKSLSCERHLVKYIKIIGGSQFIFWSVDVHTCFLCHELIRTITQVNIHHALKSSLSVGKEVLLLLLKLFIKKKKKDDLLDSTAKIHRVSLINILTFSSPLSSSLQQLCLNCRIGPSWHIAKC